VLGHQLLSQLFLNSSTVTSLFKKMLMILSDYEVNTARLSGDQPCWDTMLLSQPFSNTSKVTSLSKIS
jgi:hypothetical protein